MIDRGTARAAKGIRRSTLRVVPRQLGTEIRGDNFDVAITRAATAANVDISGGHGAGAIRDGNRNR